jgi:hypothetical protein
VIAKEIDLLDQDYRMMSSITKNSLRIGALLWRILDQNHQNQVTHQK